MPGYAYGEDTPTYGETPQGWGVFSNGSSGVVDYDSNYGFSVLEVGTNVYGPVHDLTSSTSRYIKLTQDLYGTSAGNITILFRTANVSFNQDDPPGVGPSWELYPGYKVTRTFRYIQVRIIGGQSV